MDAKLPSSPPAGIALFDLDGTLLAWDCQLLFRHFVIDREPWRAVFLPLFLALLPFAGIINSDRLKRVFLCYLWRIHPDTLATYSLEFAKSIMPAIYQELRVHINHHRQLGHLLILASASPEWYVIEIGKLLGFDLSLGTPVTIGPLFPTLHNHKGSAKVTNLQQRLPASYFNHGKLHHSHGYTDSTADLPMLAICESATVVNPSPKLTNLAEKNGWNIVRPTRPWKSRIGLMFRVIALLLGIGRDPAGINHLKP